MPPKPQNSLNKEKWVKMKGYRALLVSLKKLELACLWEFCSMASPLILNPCEFQGKFNPYVSDSITLNSLNVFKSYLKSEKPFYEL